MNPFEMIAIDVWLWLKWNAVWFAQRFTRYMMPHSGLKAGFRFGNFQVKEVGWHQWGYQRLEPKVVLSDGDRLREWYYEQFGWITSEWFLRSCAMDDVKLPENCVWVVEEQELS